MPKRLRIIGLFVAVAVGLAGCQASDAAEQVDEDSSVSEQPAPAPVIPEEPVEPDGPVIQLVSCSQADRVGMEGAITSQTEAFVEGDFELAYSYASPSFQEAVSIDAFTSLIATSYGPLTTSADLRFGECLSDADSGIGTIDARFTEGGLDVLGLRYVMQDTSEGWRVDGASSLEVVGGGA